MMKYALVFACFALGLCWAAFQLQNWVAVLLIWSALSCVVIGFAYGTHRPELIMGKDSKGRLAWFWTILNLPWLLLNWISWLLLASISREPAFNQVGGSNVFISRWPLFGVDLSSFEQLIDLTAEFPRAYAFEGRYESLPNLDGVALSNFILSQDINLNARTLVHCAQGHGRSAAFVALTLGRLELAKSAQEAIAIIIRSRPAAKMAQAQLQHVMLNFQPQLRLKSKTTD